MLGGRGAGLLATLTPIRPVASTWLSHCFHSVEIMRWKYVVLVVLFSNDVEETSITGYSGSNDLMLKTELFSHLDHY